MTRAMVREVRGLVRSVLEDDPGLERAWAMGARATPTYMFLDDEEGVLGGLISCTDEQETAAKALYKSLYDTGYRAALESILVARKLLTKTARAALKRSMDRDLR